MSKASRHIERAIEIFGSETKLAAACKYKVNGKVKQYSQNGLWQARHRGHISGELALAIHRATNGQVNAAEMRPDFWPTPKHVPVE